MKKLFISLIFLFVVAALSVPAVAEVLVEMPGAGPNATAEFRDIKVTLDGDSILMLKNTPVIITYEDSNEDILYLPLEDSLKAMGYEILWDESSDRIKLCSFPEEDKTLAVVLEDNRITPDIKTLTVIVSNKTDDIVSWSEAYHLDTKIGDKWEKLPYPKPCGFNDISCFSPSNSLSKVDVDIERIYGQLTPGLYRLVKEFNGEDFFLEFEVREYISDDIDSVEVAEVKMELDGSVVSDNEWPLSVVKKDETEAVLYVHWNELRMILGLHGSMNEEQSAFEMKYSYEPSPDVVMSVRDKQITTRTGDMTLDITYYTKSGYINVDMSYVPGSSLLPGSAFYIEKETNGKWEKLPDRSEGEDLYGSYRATDGENTEHYNIDIFKHYERLSPGKYRVVKSFRTLYVETFYYAEFEVSED